MEGKTMKEIDDLLQECGLRKTAFRRQLLSLFINTKSTLSIDSIKKKIGDEADKVTVYRALEAFEKNGLVHRVPDMGNITRYAVNQSLRNHSAHVHNHAHFICTKCEETFCVESVEVPDLKISGGYYVKRASLTLEGECPECLMKNQSV